MSPRAVAQRLVWMFQSTHPGPSLAVTCVAVILGFGLGLDAGRLIVLGLAILLGQFSVGLSNDWLDAERDRRSGRADKPIARGLVSTRSVAFVAFASLAIAVALTATLSLSAAVAHAVALAAAWGYNLGLKSTVLSPLPYVIAFGALPVIAANSAEPAVGSPWWIVGAGALFGLAAHFANVLPDLVDDRATGVSGLPQRAKPRSSGIVIFLSLLIASALITFGDGSPPTVFGLLSLAMTGCIAVAGIALVWAKPPSRLLFQLVIASALVVVAALAASLASSRM